MSNRFKARAVTSSRNFALVPALLGLAVSARAELEVVGVTDSPLLNVLAYLDLDDLDCDSEPRAVRTQFNAAPQQVISALQAYGFYDIDLSTSLEFEPDCWRARIEIEPGEPVRIRNLRVELTGSASDDPVFALALVEYRLAEGNVLEHGSYEALKNRFSDLARDRGYARAQFVANRIDVYPDLHAADIELVFDSGPRYRFGEIRFEQATLSEDLVRSYLGFATGQPYLYRRLSELYIALSDTGYFQLVDVLPSVPDHDSETIDVDVRLTPAPRRLISYGVGFSSDTGPRLRFGRSNRRRNDRGHQLRIDAQLSPVISEVNADYRFPYGDPREEWVSFDAGVRSEDTETSESESLELGARRVFTIGTNWWRTQMLRLAVEDFTVGEQIGRSRLLMPGVEWRRQRADNAVRPNNGSKLSFEVRAAADQLGSDTSFMQSVVQGKWIRSISERGRILIRGQFGVTWAASFRDLPPSVRFFAGGDHSVRGYGFETLGPVGTDGEVIGGTRLFTTSFEYERQIRPKWSLAWFVDSGNAFERSEIDLKTGVGMGARWQSPLGPIRVDVAAPLDDDRSVRLHVTLGPDL